MRLKSITLEGLSTTLGGRVLLPFCPGTVLGQFGLKLGFLETGNGALHDVDRSALCTIVDNIGV